MSRVIALSFFLAVFVHSGDAYKINTDMVMAERKMSSAWRWLRGESQTSADKCDRCDPCTQNCNPCPYQCEGPVATPPPVRTGRVAPQPSGGFHSGRYLGLLLLLCFFCCLCGGLLYLAKAGDKPAYHPPAYVPPAYNVPTQRLEPTNVPPAYHVTTQRLEPTNVVRSPRSQERVQTVPMAMPQTQYVYEQPKPTMVYEQPVVYGSQVIAPPIIAPMQTYATPTYSTQAPVVFEQPVQELIGAPQVMYSNSGLNQMVVPSMGPISNTRRLSPTGSPVGSQNFIVMP